MSMTRLEKSNDFIRLHLKRGGRVQTYLCPHCEGIINAPSPLDEDHTWDSLSVCPHCEGLHLQIVHYNSAKAVGA